MCTVCGCDTGTETVSHGHAHVEATGHGHSHHQTVTHNHGTHVHTHVETHVRHRTDAGPTHVRSDGLRSAPGLVDAGGGIAGVHVPGLSQDRIIRIERDILSKNDAFARGNRQRLRQAGVLALNLMSGPGSGKTTLLCRVIESLRQRIPIAVIEGDQQTSNDADRIRATGAPAVQVNTGKGCHLDAHMVGHAMDDLALPAGGVLFIENVGNLVCPAAFDLGEAHKVVMLSVTEGEDKPAKYPGIFAAADLMLLTKCDLLPHLDFDTGACMAAALRINPRLQILPVSARSGEGMAALLAWIEARIAPLPPGAAPA